MITAGRKYKKLIDRCALRPLTSEADLDVALAVSESLFKRLDELEVEEEDYLNLLGQLIETYEKQHHALPDTEDNSPADMLRWLMDVNGQKQVDLAAVLGVSSGRMSELANGHRDFSKSQITKLARHFNVGPGLFLPKDV